MIEFLPAEKKAYRESEEGRVLVETGLLRTGVAFLFVCPTCGRVVVSEQRLEPACNGLEGEHALEPMLVFERKLNPI
jgi:hypothetical protein